MKKIHLIFCAFLFAMISVSAQTQITIIDSIKSGGINRTYRLYVPKSYHPQKTSALIVDLHGYSSNASQEQLYSNFMPIADTANFLVLYPEGTFSGNSQFWNAGISSAWVNDVAFLSELIDHLQTQFNIDVNSIYACGMSMGGFMSHTLACALNNKIAAIASVTGSMFMTQYNTCNPTRVVPVMQIHGTADKTVTYNGNTAMINIYSLVQYWVRIDQ
jgi:polyhydroxybutyrate depolymerase